MCVKLFFSSGDLSMCQELCPVVLDARRARVLKHSFGKRWDMQKVVSAFGFVGLIPMAAEARDPEGTLIWKVSNAKVSCQQVLSDI